MARKRLNFLLVFFLLTFSWPVVQSDDDEEEGNIKVDISNKGLDFIKDLLIEKAESSLVPLELPNIEKTVKIPVVGKVDMVLSNITIHKIDMTSSTVKAGDTGLVIAVSGATADLGMNWKYSYSTWLLPIAVSDKGSASIKVEGMDIGLTLSLETLQGSLKLSLLEFGCYVNTISIKLDGGASWLYQGLIDAFEDKIGYAVESAITKKIKEGIVKLDSALQNLPKEVPITDIAALNVTFIDDPELSESSLDLEINGLLSARNKVELSNHHKRYLKTSSTCKTADNMVMISLHEDVLKSASSVYFEANKLHWTVDKVPDQSILNTAWWRFIVPQLYKKYPNDDISLNISVSSPPIIKVGKQHIDATIPLDMVIDVLDNEEIIQVACISIEISASLLPDIASSSVVGSVKLNEFSMSLKWSKIGDFHMRLIQSVISTTLKTVVLPYVNVLLKKGLRLPTFHGYMLQDAQILCMDPWVLVCSNVGLAN